MALKISKKNKEEKDAYKRKKKKMLYKEGKAEKKQMMENSHSNKNTTKITAYIAPLISNLNIKPMMIIKDEKEYK